jgi:hypothetical protein
LAVASFVLWLRDLKLGELQIIPNAAISPMSATRDKTGVTSKLV